MSHRVSNGDTLWSIANRYRTSVDALVRANPQIKNPDLIHPGQQLNIPGSRDEFVSAESAVASAPQASGATAADVPESRLSRGDEGPEVKQLQDCLVHLGYMSEGQVATGPGIFGPRTDAALRAFQADHGLVADGCLGWHTRNALVGELGGQAQDPAPLEMPQAPETPMQEGVPVVDLQQGMEGPAVEILQGSLVKLGYMAQSAMATGPGTFGPRTAAALRSFQAAYGVESSGYYGEETRQALASALNGAAPIERPQPEGGDFRARALSAAQGELGRWDMYRYLNGHGPEAWCNDFVSWCYQQAGKSIGEDGWYRYVPYMQKDLKASGEWLGRWDDPSPGDIVCFDWDADGVPDHTGLVESVNADGSVNTIEGNVDGSNDWNGVLSRKVRSRNVITGFGHLR